MRCKMKSGNLVEKHLWRGFLMLIYHHVTFEKVYVTFRIHVVDNVF